MRLNHCLLQSCGIFVSILLCFSPEPNSGYLRGARCRGPRRLASYVGHDLMFDAKKSSSKKSNFSGRKVIFRAAMLAKSPTSSWFGKDPY